jgi:hypothetical protein
VCFQGFLVSFESTCPKSRRHGSCPRPAFQRWSWLTPYLPEPAGFVLRSILPRVGGRSHGQGVRGKDAAA